MVRLHDDIRKASDELKRLHADAENLRRRSELDPRAGQIKPGAWVRILHGSRENAAYTRKHGHGEPWKHRYKVEEVRPHAIRVRVPKDGSVPIVQEWQLIRRCEPTSIDEHKPQSGDPVLTEKGIPLPMPTGTATAGAGAADVADDPDRVWEIEKILRAEKVSGKYRLWVKWADYADPTPEWRHFLVAQTSNRELLEEIDEAVRRCQEELRLQEGDQDDEADEAAAVELENILGKDAVPAELGRGQRVRKQATLHNASWVLQDNFHASLSGIQYLAVLLTGVCGC